jgi:uncharacterized membrane protein (UPF0127 family)
VTVSRIWFAAVALLLVPACSSHPAGGAETATAAATIPLTIKSAKAEHKFRIEIARTQEDHERGLMFRKSLPDDGGMIFPMIPPRMATFWMKNTEIPLDMIFIRPDGTIARIEAETIPYSLEPVQSGEPVSAVLEIGGGKAEALGIAAGDRVIWDDPKD